MRLPEGLYGAFVPTPHPSWLRRATFPSRERQRAKAFWPLIFLLGICLQLKSGGVRPSRLYYMRFSVKLDAESFAELNVVLRPLEEKRFKILTVNALELLLPCVQMSKDRFFAVSINEVFQECRRLEIRDRAHKRALLLALSQRHRIAGNGKILLTQVFRPVHLGALAVVILLRKDREL